MEDEQKRRELVKHLLDQAEAEMDAAAGALANMPVDTRPAAAAAEALEHLVEAVRNLQGAIARLA